MAYATVDDVTELWAREPEPEVVALIGRRFAQVERMILRRIPDLATRIEAGDPDLADVADIEAEAVLRVARNPRGPLQRAGRLVRLPALARSGGQQAPHPSRGVGATWYQAESDVLGGAEPRLAATQLVITLTRVRPWVPRLVRRG